VKKGRKPLSSLSLFLLSLCLTFLREKKQKKKYTHPKFFVFQKKEGNDKKKRTSHVEFATLNKNKKAFHAFKTHTHTHKKMSQSMQATGRVRFLSRAFLLF
jgi:hypothetical protein